MPAASLPSRPQTTLERVFSAHFLLDVGGQPRNDQAFYVHPNGLAVLCLAPSHWAVQQLATPSSELAGVSVAFGDGLLSAEVSGKRKRGAATLRPDTVVATLTVPGRPPCALLACVRAKLLEVNSRLLEPATAAASLGHLHDDAGFLAVVMPFDAACLQALRDATLTQEQYNRVVTARLGGS